MLSQESKKSNVQIWVGITLIAGLLGLAGGMGLATTVLDSSGDSGLESELRDSQARVSQLEAEVRDSTSQDLVEQLELQLSQAEARASSALQSLAQKESELELLSSAQEQIATLQEQVQSLQSQGPGSLEAVREISDTIERHRLLLVELRKDLPQTREESIAYWNNIKTLASRANPALTSPADKVILKIDNYFDWNERSPNSFASSDDYLNWLLTDYARSGAIAYEDATATFTRDALLSVINELESVVSQLN